MLLRRFSAAFTLPLSLSLLLCLGGCRGGSGSGGGDDSGSDPDDGREYDFGTLTSTLDAFVGDADDQVSGYSFILDIGGTTALQCAGGDLSTSSVIPIASASKAPAAATILSMVEDGLINLDTPVSRYIGAAVDWPDAKASITMRMLLNHTSGIALNTPCLSDQQSTLLACVQEIANTPLAFTPGSQFGYSGAGYQVAGFVAQQASGQSWSTLLHERVTSPLGMSSFNFGTTQNPRIGAGANSNAADYLKFSRMTLNGGTYGGVTVLSSEQAARAKTNQVAGLPVFYTPFPQDAGVHGYSFGWWITDADQLDGSAGPEISDPGLLGTTPWVDFDKDYAAVLLLRSNTTNGLAMWNAIRPLIREQVEAHGASE